MSFWGLVLKENKRYSQTVKKAFHISHAALDLDASTLKETEVVQVWVNSDGGNHLLCNLSQAHPNVALDIPFGEGEQIALFGKGPGTTHLTGYLADEEPNYDDFGEEEEDSDVENVEQQLVEKKKNKQPKAVANGDAAEDDSSEDDSDLDDLEAALDGIEDDDEDDEEGPDSSDEEDDDSDSDEEDEVVEPPKKVVKLDKTPKAKQNGVPNGKSPKEQKEPKKQKEPQPKPEAKGQKAKTLSGGVTIEDLRVGKGPEAKRGRRVTVYYEGRLKNSGKVFDSSKSGEGFTFSLGKGEVISGWEIGIAGMKVGSKRRITCPPGVAYGPRGSPPVIPPNSTLVFDVELRGVK